ncbi:tRNA (N6-threonylcarbamoyladenosine(37)-N6)-methyltransferase TrmO [Paraferrimonas haliotis]|uniref:tRNA (N6-threonylcarbamoyladenosine(37)-N6)-methyltransferase TrmO n=1 Tax=Paraferrimonas haliotis TaxID=2013866 RepID=A0AA37WVL1_9GAMM|nr:tRNA (N6-threonylcarbamoyladenosine(37)-N6)-methyltransferase TrmO [Paraferrimonas haliotis]GLS82698.1 tRNA (N6-threonylcarbamoyladenosine(37)-N6)-methyltransferase TrmO [Paraferrimonas haliotis]
MTQTYPIEPIAVCTTPYSQKFAVPRQPGLVTAANGVIELLEGYNNPDLVRGIEQYSHLWLTFVFDKTLEQGWRPTIRPPRLGGNQRIGVLASRSPFRPNGLGQSVVKLEKVEISGTNVKLHISGMDLVNQTPVIDIKPYIPYSDAVASATAGMAQQKPTLVKVEFSSEVNEQMALLNSSDYPQLPLLIKQIIEQDPRPAYKKGQTDQKIYTMTLFDLEISWRYHNECAKVTLITKS